VTALDPTLERIIEVCPGWSGQSHWDYFAQIAKEPFTDFLFLGVYLGRDIAMMSSLLKGIWITGVDLFSDTACADWPPEKRDLSWQDAWQVQPPNMARARANLEELGHSDGIMLHKERAQDFLLRMNRQWDFIYLDTSHDYASVAMTLGLAVPRCRAILAGDDYNWPDVKRAVNERFREVSVWDSAIWTVDLRE
jgi:hypothetical protein